MQKFFKLLRTIRTSKSGFTTLELMIVIVIIGIITAVSIPRLMKMLDTGKVTACKKAVEQITVQLEVYNMHNQTYPTTEQGLKALVEPATIDPVPANFQEGGYLSNKDLKDPWGHDFIYRSPGDSSRNFEILSYGSDGKEGGTGNAADIKSWD